jgi:hypothetical protein
MAVNPARRRLDTSVHRFFRASSRSRTQHRGTRSRTRTRTRARARARARAPARRLSLIAYRLSLIAYRSSLIAHRSSLIACSLLLFETLLDPRDNRCAMVLTQYPRIDLDS